MLIIELTIQRKTETGYPVIASLTRAGGALPLRREGTLVLDIAALAALVYEPLEYGVALGKALFVDDIRDTFREGMADGGPLHVHLSIEAPDLRAIDWHRLTAPFDGGKWRFLAVQQSTPFSLDVPSPARGYFPAIGRRDLRALILVAGVETLSGSYKNLSAFDVAATKSSIQQALGAIPSDVLETPTLDALCAALTATPYTILHIVCHGDVNDKGESILYFPKDADGAPVRAGELLNRLANVKHLPHFTYLGPCDTGLPQNGFGSLAQRLIRELGLPVTLAMTEKISIATAQAIATPFYAQLQKHGSPDLALAESLAGLQGRPDLTVPALFSRLGDRPLFSDSLERDLTNKELEFGLTTLAGLLSERAPVLLHERPPIVFSGQPLVLMDSLDLLTRRLRATLGADASALSESGRKERQEAIAALNQLSLESLDLSFNAVCQGQTPPAYDSSSPFRGLQSFRPEDSRFFFGREKLTQQLINKLNEHPFLAVLGISGSGKSSLVMAGLIPTLNVPYAIFRPGAEPLLNLEKAVQTEPQLLVVDQFEELFTITRSALRAEFVSRLLEQVGRRRVVVTLRADFIGEAALFKSLRDQVQNHQELIPPMDDAELRRAMEAQAGQVSLRFEPGLSQQILDDVAGEPGAMPLLQHALWELWKRRHGRVMRADEYHAFGGVRQAIAGTAEEVFARCAPPEQARLQDIFLRLTRLDADNTEQHRDTRRRVQIKELIPAESDPVATTLLLKQLADARLVVVSGDEVEIAHEALIRHWDRLQGWLNDGRADLLAYQHLQQSAREWAQAQRQPDLLYPASRIKSAEKLRAGGYALNADETAFLLASQVGAKRQRVQQYALWVLIGIFVVGFLALVPGRLVYYEILRQQVLSASPTVPLTGGKIIFGTDDIGRSQEEPKLQKVDVASFAMEAFEVTNQKYHTCVDAGACDKPHVTTYYDDPAYANHPVVHVTLDQANAYCAWLGRRLPTTYEWELAARGAQGQNWPWGNEPLPTKDRANVIIPPTPNEDWYTPTGTLPVGSLKAGATANGIFDLVGNVWEWTTTVHEQGGYIQRGGGWMTLPSRITGIRISIKDGPDQEVGFRCGQ